MTFIRQNSCNLCGQCCGGPGSPEPANPWTASFPQSIRLWSDAEVDKVLPLWRQLGLARNAAGELYVKNASGRIRIGTTQYDYEWGGVYGAWHKPGSCECPLLKADPGDGTRPCALHDNAAIKTLAWDGYCDEGGPQGLGFPPYEMASQAQVDEWFRRHPGCSYTYVEA